MTNEVLAFNVYRNMDSVYSVRIAFMVSALNKV